MTKTNPSLGDKVFENLFLFLMKNKCFENVKIFSYMLFYLIKQQTNLKLQQWLSGK